MPTRHRRSVRLRSHDYTAPGAYFVTIATHEHAAVFGEVAANEMHLSATGEIADACWREIPAHFPQVDLGTFVVMPNHLHGILILRATFPVKSIGPTVGATKDRRGTIYRAPTEAFGRPQIGSIPTIVRTYKAAVTRGVTARSGRGARVWQRNFYEHVIRDEQDWDRIRRYIEANPANWPLDEENPAPADEE